MSVARSCGVGRKTNIRSSPDALFSCRLHDSRTDRCHCLPEQRSRLWHSLPSHRRDLVHHRCRSPTSGRRDRLFRRTSQLGTEPVFPSSSALCRTGRRDFTGWCPVDPLPPQLFLAGKGALPAVPPIVLAISAGGLRRRQVAVFHFASGTPRSAGFHRSSRFGARRGMGRLRQAAFRRPTASGGLSRPLHTPRGHFQSSDRRYRRWPSEIYLERLPRQQSAENHAPLGGRVHPAIFAPRATEWVPPHSLLRVPRQSTPQGEVGALPPTSRHGSSNGKFC